MATGTSSPAAATTAVVWAAAAVLAALIVEPILAKSVAAAATKSGVAITKDIAGLPPLTNPGYRLVVIESSLSANNLADPGSASPFRQTRVCDRFVGESDLIVMCGWFVPTALGEICAERREAQRRRWLCARPNAVSRLAIHLRMST